MFNSISDIPSSTPVVRFKLPFGDMLFTKNPSQIRQILSDPTTFDFEPMKVLALKRILGLPKKVIDLASQDNSGVNKKPISSTIIPQSRRFNYMERQATKDFTRPASHNAFLEKFEENLYHEVERCAVGTSWVHRPDLFQFIRSILFRATTNAFYGPQLLQIAHGIEGDFLKFDDNVPFHAKGLPNILNREGGKVRARCIEAFRKWRKFVLNDRSTSLPEWNERSGLKTTTLRKELFEQFREWDDYSCAASDLAVLFGLVSLEINNISESR